MAGAEGFSDGWSSLSSHALPPIIWRYSAKSDALTESVLMYRAAREWEQARRHGLRVESLIYRGRALSEREIDVLELWIEAGGAKLTAKLDHWVAVAQFEYSILGMPRSPLLPRISEL